MSGCVCAFIVHGVMWTWMRGWRSRMGEQVVGACARATGLVYHSLQFGVREEAVAGGFMRPSCVKVVRLRC